MHKERMNPNELCDEALDAVSGGAFDTEKYKIGDKVMRMGRCPGCGKTDMYGTIIGFFGVKRGGSANVLLRMDCCGKEIRPIL